MRKQLLAQLETGEMKVEETTWAVIPGPLRRLLARCAVPRAFDEHMVRSALAAGLPHAPSFDELTAHWMVEPVPGRAGAFRLRREVRDEARDRWMSDPALVEELATVSRAIDESLRRRGPEWQVERLYHLWATRPRAAARQTRKLFHSAERKLDLGACQEILAVLAECSTQWPAAPDAQQLLVELRPRFATRALFADDYYKTARFLERPRVEAQVAPVLSGNDAWILMLHAAGGLGKTSFLRWLVARRLVPVGAACARIDFDDPAPKEAWRLLLRLAEQLEQQVAGRSLRSIVVEMRRHEGAYARGQTSASRATLDDKILHMLGSALAESGARTPVVIILDTLEEALIHLGVELADLLDLLGQIRRTARRQGRQLVVILSGRYDVLARQDEACEAVRRRHGKNILSVGLTPFTRAESSRYLLERRRVPKDDRIAVAVEKSDGIPLKLALLADLLLGDPDLTREDLARSSRVDLVYLVDRVLKRIPDEHEPLRWVLRYGVVARRLTRELLEEVLAPHILKGIAGEALADDLSRDPEEVRKRHLFGKMGARPLDLQALWGELLRYVGESSWVRRAEGAPEAVAFHGDVLWPMRSVVEAQPVFRALNADAAVFYERKAKGDPERWAEQVAEAVYHRFQLGRQEGEAFWRLSIQHAIQEGKPEWRRAIAAELMRSEYLDDEGHPRVLPDGQPVVSRELLAEANVHLADAALELAERSRANGLLVDQAREALTRARRLGASPGAPRIGAKVALTSARLALLDGEMKPALESVGAIPEDADQAERAAAASLKTEVLKKSGGHALEAMDEQARLIDARPDDPRIAPALAKLVADLSQRDLHARAIQRAEQAVKLSRTPAERVVRTLAPAYIAAKMPAAAHAALEEIGHQEPKLEAERNLQLARAALGLRRPLREAEARLNAAEAHASERGQAAEVEALAWELRGAALGQIGIVDWATATFDEALGRWKRLSDLEGIGGCRRRFATFLLRLGGQVAPALAYLQENETIAGDLSAPLRVANRILLAELRAAQLDRGAAREALKDQPERQLGPALLARLSLERGIHSDGCDREMAVGRALEALGDVETISARAAVLAVARRLGEPSRALGAAISALPWHELDGLHPADRSVAETRIAQALLACIEHPGDDSWREARKRIRAAIATPAGPLHVYELMQLQAKLGWAEEDVAAFSKATVHFRQALGSTPLFARARSLLAGTPAQRLMEEPVPPGAAEDWAPLLHWLKQAGNHVARGARLAASPHDFIAQMLQQPAPAPPAQASTPPRAAPGTAAQRRILRISIANPAPGRLSVTARWPDAGGVNRELDSTASRTVAELVRPLSTSELFPFELVSSYAKDWRTAARELGGALYWNVDLFRIGEPLDLELRVSAPAWQAIPWELVTVGPAAMPASFVPKVRHAYRPARPASRRHRGGVAILDQAKSAGAGGKHSLVHLSGIEFQESADGAIELIPARNASAVVKESTDWSIGLQPVSLAQRFGAGAPVIVLDVAPASGPTETARQLFLRNRFAAELAELGDCSAVIATGLVTYEQQAEARRGLTDAIARHLSVGEACRQIRALAEPALRRRDRARFEEIAGPAGTALFTADPDEPLVLD